MTLRQLFRSLLILTVLLTGCATLPKAELEAADEAIAKAEAAEAERFAPAEWNAAVGTKQEAEQLVNNGEFSEARDKAVAATAAAKAAVTAADKNRAIFEENERKRQEEEARLQAEREAAEAAAAQDPFAFDDEGADPFAEEFDDFPAENEAAAGEEDAFAEEFEEETIAAPPPVAAAPKPEPVTPPPPAPAPAPVASSYSGESRPYMVQRYDTLAKVAYKQYGDGKLWYIIYNANRDLIKDPDLLPRVEIMIPVSPSEGEKEEARRINENHVPNLWDGM